MAWAIAGVFGSRLQQCLKGVDSGVPGKGQVECRALNLVRILAKPSQKAVLKKGRGRCIPRPRKIGAQRSQLLHCVAAQVCNSGGGA